MSFTRRNLAEVQRLADQVASLAGKAKALVEAGWRAAAAQHGSHPGARRTEAAMKVSELIARLSKLPPDDEVRLDWHDEIEAIYRGHTSPSDRWAWILSPHERDRDLERAGRVYLEGPTIEAMKMHDVVMVLRREPLPWSHRTGSDRNRPWLWIGGRWRRPDRAPLTIEAKSWTAVNVDPRMPLSPPDLRQVRLDVHWRRGERSTLTTRDPVKAELRRDVLVVSEGKWWLEA